MLTGSGQANDTVDGSIMVMTKLLTSMIVNQATTLEKEDEGGELRLNS